MADAPKPESVPTEGVINNRIKETQAHLDILTAEVRALGTRLAALDPKVLAALQAENQVLLSKAVLLEKASYGILVKTQEPAQEDDFRLRYEAVKQTAVDYFNKSNIDLDLWKNIES